MKTCLMHAAAFERMSGALTRFRDDMQIITMADDGVFKAVGSGDVITAPDPQIVYGNADAFFSPEVGAFLNAVMQASSLDWFQSSAAGLDHPVLASIRDKAANYTTNHTQAEAMAEWAIWQALDWMKYGPRHRAQQKDAVWERIDQKDFDGSKWLIIGFGSIGEAVARRVQALGGRVTGVRRSGGASVHAENIITPDQMGPALEEADIVLLSLPLTDETENMADADFFSTMKPDTLFMNLGRGALVDEAALIAEMDLGKPAHAALDVTGTEPLPESSPLWHHPNISLTPHDSAITPGTLRRADETFLLNLERYVDGAELKHLVSRD